MKLEPGVRLGSYEVVSPLGAGGMGEVWRARDTRLGRDVAVKVLPSHLAEHPEALERFDREAKALGALSHPNILSIHDLGTHEGSAYVVMELLEGETLRQRLSAGPLPSRKAVEVASQIARGLAAAHEKGVVHRDLKPENVFLTRDGRVKLLDFGLARQAAPLARADDTRSPTLARPTDPGTVLGTVGYMSPEQVRGDLADHRSDLFSFGCVLYEMLAGRRAFQRATAAETMTAILREDPEDPAGPGAELAPAVERIVRHCLEKNPAERFQSAHDLAFDLEAAEGTSRSAPRAAEGRRVSRRFLSPPVLALGALALSLAAGYGIARRPGSAPGAEPEPAFKRLTFRSGTIWSARFAPDGQTVVYGAAWDGQPIRLFVTRLDSPESAPVSLPDATLLAIASTGELAVSLGHRHVGWMGEGTLARAPLLGGGARPVLENVREADWSPDGSALAVVRRVGGRERLEFPIGRTLYDTTGYVSHIRVSPDATRIAFADHPIWSDDIGWVAVVDREGHKVTLGERWDSLRGVAWAPSGDEIWFTAARGGDGSSLRAVDLRGRQRTILGGPMGLVLFDVSRSGQLLLGRETHLRRVEGLAAGNDKPRDFSLPRDNSVGRQLAPDGNVVVLSDQSVPGYATYIRRADGSPPVRLGEGDAYQVSPDGKWVLAITAESPARLLLHPTGPGQAREVPIPAGLHVDIAGWLPSGRGLVAFGTASGQPPGGYVLDLDGGPPRLFTQGDTGRLHQVPVISPDDQRVVASDASGRCSAYPVGGGAPEPIPGLTDRDLPIQWTADGRALFVVRLGEVLLRVRRLDLTTGRETPWTEILPAETAGLRLSQVFITPSGRFWVHSYSRLLTDLYAAEGLR